MNKFSDDLVKEVVKRILSVVVPLQIVLFGSAARGTMKPDSDLDLLVIVPNGRHRRKTSIEVFKALRGIGFPKDIIVVTENDVKSFGDNPSLIIKPALEEGKVIYDSC